MEELIRNKSNEIIEDLRERMKSKGLELTSDMEYYIRIGMGYGITISGLALNHLPSHITLTED